MTVILAIHSKDYQGIAADGLACAGDIIAQTDCDKLIKFKNYIIGTAGIAIVGDLMRIFKTTRELDKPIKSKADVYTLYLKVMKLVKEHQQAYGNKGTEGSDFDFILLTKEGKVFDCNEYGNIHEITDGITGIGSGYAYAESYFIGVNNTTTMDVEDIQRTLIDSIKYSATKINNVGGEIILKDFTS